MTGQTRRIVFLSGLGQRPQVWEPVRAGLPAGFAGEAAVVPGLHDEREFSLAAARDELFDTAAADGPVHLCGLSLGAVIALAAAVERPERIASLVLSGAQFRLDPRLMRLQRGLLRVLPERFVAPVGMDRRRMLSVLAALEGLDLGAGLERVRVPTLVLCGARDRANLPAARALAQRLPRAELQIVPRAGHEWNRTMPDAFAARLGAFLRELPEH